ncbi:hypothetical protein [Desulfosporosinus fructosivorans]
MSLFYEGSTVSLDVLSLSSSNRETPTSSSGSGSAKVSFWVGDMNYTPIAIHLGIAASAILSTGEYRT